MITVAFDIDHTLWKVVEYQNNGKWMKRQVPDYALGAVLHWFYNNGDKIYVWSAGGVDYAQQIVDKLGFTDMVEIMPKGNWNGRPHIDLCFDDEDVELARTNIQVKRDPFKDPIII